MRERTAERRSVRLPAAVCAALLAAAPARAAAAAAGTAPDDATLLALAIGLSLEPDPTRVPGGGSPRAAAPTVRFALAETTSEAAAEEVELSATVRAKTLRFDAVPDRMRILPPGGAVPVVWRVERVNLPARPERGRVYGDVEVRLTVTTSRGVLAALLAEARHAARSVSIGPAPSGASGRGDLGGGPLRGGPGVAERRADEGGVGRGAEEAHHRDHGERN
jgi:hypothetical protein